MGRAMTIGERVAWYRRRRGLSQEVLAGLVDRTTDWLSKVENGRANLDRISVVTALADALDVTVGDLLGEPSVVQWPGSAPQRTVTLLRETLMDYASLTLALTDAEPMQLGELRTGVESAWSAYQSSRFGYATTVLPRLLAGAHAASREAANDEDRREAERLLALTYHAAAATLGKVGEGEMGWIAADRGLAAAEASGDPKVVASLLRSVAHSMMLNGRHGPAAGVVSRATDRLTRGEQPADPTWWSLLGSLYLTGAMAAARADQAGEARAFLARARQAGALLGHDANYAWTAFGPTNVAVHDVSVALELGDLQVALHLAPQVDGRGLPVERRVRHLLEVARVYHLANKPDDAVRTMVQAEQDSPEQVRYHYIARELVTAWMRNRGTRELPQVGGLAQRLQLV
jgi:transcriptional regulator with XRE-family HTH domain